MPEEQHLPELARSLRTLGATHGAAAESAHAAVFGPLLDARARAALGGLDSALVVFRGHALAARILSRAAEAARASEVDAARARARVARAREALEPLHDALHALDALAALHAGGAPTHLADAVPATTPNALWMAQLARVFRIADDACVELSRVLGEREEVPLRHGWRGRLGR